MIWWHWVVGTVEFAAVAWGTDYLTYARRSPEAVEKRRIRYEQYQRLMTDMTIADQQRHQLRHLHRQAPDYDVETIVRAEARLMVERKREVLAAFSQYEPPGVYMKFGPPLRSVDETHHRQITDYLLYD